MANTKKQNAIEALLDEAVARGFQAGRLGAEPVRFIDLIKRGYALVDEPPAQDFASAPISLDARRADKARDSKLYSARDAMVEELRDIDAGVVEVDAMVLFTRIPDGNGLWTSGWRFAGLNTTEAVGFTALCLNMLMDRSRTGG